MYWTTDDYFLMACCTAFTCAVCTCYLIWDYGKHRDILSPGVWIPGFYFLFYFTRVTLTLIPGTENLPYFFTAYHNLPYACLLNSVGIIGVVVGLSIVGDDSLLARRLPNFDLNMRTNARPFQLMLAGMYVVMAACNFLGHESSFGPEMANRMGVVGMMSPCALAYVLEVSCLLRSRFVIMILIAVAIGLGIVPLLMYGSRSGLLGVLVAIGLPIYYTRWNILSGSRNQSNRSAVRRKVLVMVVCLITALAATSYYKGYVFPGDQSASAGNPSLADITLNILVYLDYNFVLTNEIDHYSDGDYLWGSSLFYAIIGRLVPFSLTGIRLYESPGEMFQVYMGVGYLGQGPEQLGLDYALNAEGYINFGFFGVAIIMFIVSAVTKMIYVKYVLHRKTDLNCYSLTAPYILVAMAPHVLRRQFQSFVNYSVAMIVVMWLFLQLAKLLEPNDSSCAAGHIAE